ncbi:Crp/Fnr family transcriptional regulator [Chitinophaga horti]|uniref:Crp/Fnr family transcriptional regulator n=1 Tax=Chitinophaga horti TaxID=2920382 RepID=A0ABY6J4B2_9BACT|nr:Crp/Fnr family transcriptional regulator [Chitinophaga horti]UYQ93047.1 Crp/Fnr family transcriptional regulator [Chitinophaga horti]
MQIDQLKAAVQATVQLPPEQWEELAACWEPVSYKRKEVVTAAGEVERYVYFVLEGVQRAFAIEGDREATIVFNYTGSFSGVIDSFLLQQPSRYYLETLTACRCLRMPYAELVRLMDKYPLIERWVRLGTTWALSGVMERHIEMLTSNAEQKFRKLLARSPHVLNLIPHKYLASYLGIDPATFSKLLSTVRL